MKSHIAYVLFSLSYHKIYIGYASNLKQRFISHNHLGKKGWTIKYRPWALIHSECFSTKREALIREKQLKSAQGRAWIKREIISKFLSSPN